MPLHENDSYWAKSAHEFDKHTNPDIRALVKRIGNDIGHVNRVLDVAAGTGAVSLELAKCVRQVDAIDLEPEMISVAQKRQQNQALQTYRFMCKVRMNLPSPIIFLMQL